MLPPRTAPDLLRWIHDDVSVRGSSIHGRGLFARQSIQPGTVIVRFGGYFCPVASRYDTSIVQPGSAVGIGEFVLLAEHNADDKDPSDYINHSCEPNLGMADAVTLMLIKEAYADEELTADYAYWEADPSYIMKTPCNCKAGSCRQQVTGNDWREHGPTLEHLSTWSAPFIKRRILSRES